MAHGRSRSGNVLVPLASGGRHECFLPGSAHMAERLKTGATVRLRAPSYAARMRQSTSIPSFSVCSGRVPERRQSANCPISNAYVSTSSKS